MSFFLSSPILRWDLHVSIVVGEFQARMEKRTAVCTDGV